MPSETEPLRNEIRIAAPPEVVFPYFTDPARMVSWMGVAAVLDPRPGGTFRIQANGRDVVLGEFVEVAPPHRVVFTWGFDGPDPFVAPGSTRVEVTLQADEHSPSRPAPRSPMTRRRGPDPYLSTGLRRFQVPDVTYKRIDEMDGIYDGIARRARAELGVSSFGMQVMSLPPRWDGYPDHDHGPAATDPGQEEVYLPLEGDGTLVADGHEYALRPGVAIRVGAEQSRRILPGDRGLRFLALGGIPGAFTAPAWTEVGAAPPVAAPPVAAPPVAAPPVAAPPVAAPQ